MLLICYLMLLVVKQSDDCKCNILKTTNDMVLSSHLKYIATYKHEFNWMTLID